MHKHLKTFLGATAAIALLAAPALHARANSGGMPMVGQGSETTMGSGAMMGPGAGTMMGMMNMMGQTSQMAQNCNAMMTSMTTNHGATPNRQWQQPTPPKAPERHD